MNGELMREEMAQQPEALARFIGRFDEHVQRVRELVPEPPVGANPGPSLSLQATTARPASISTQSPVRALKRIGNTPRLKNVSSP